MPAFEIAPDEKKVIGKITFNKKTDYKVVELDVLDRKGETTGLKKRSLLHNSQADTLIKLKRAVLVKDADFELVETNRTVQKIKKK